MGLGRCPVDLIDHQDRFQVKFQRFFQNEFRLRHGAFKSVDQQKDTVDHFQDPFHFTTEIRVAGRINDIKLDAFVDKRSVFRENGYTALFFQRIGIHHNRFPFLECIGPGLF